MSHKRQVDTPATVLGIRGEGAIVFGRRPEHLIENTAPRRLASNAASPYKFAYARTALKYGLKAIGFAPGDALLVPELICESALEPLERLGITPHYYPVSPTLVPEWHQVEHLITKDTKALLVVHYFGQPQLVPECLRFCRSHSLMLIEDNAHGFGGTFEGRLLGTFGMIGVSAPRKSFPIRNGAYLYAATDISLDVSPLQPQPAASSRFKHHLKNWLKQVPPFEWAQEHRRRLAEKRRRLGPAPPYGSQEAFRDPPLPGDYGMDESTEAFLQQQDIEHVRDVRRQIYYLWQRWADVQEGLRPVFPDLSPGAIPLVFPAYTESAAYSRHWYDRGHRAGVDIHSWPTLPQAIVERDSGAMRLWERLVCFPIHQEMNFQLLAKRMALL